MSSTPTRAVAVASSSRTPRQQMVMSGTSGRNRVDAQVIATNGTSSGRKMQPSPNALSPAASQRSYGGNFTDGSLVAGMSSARRAPVDHTGNGGMVRGIKKVHGIRAALALHGPPSEAARLAEQPKRMVRKVQEPGNITSIADLGRTATEPTSVEKPKGGKRCLDGSPSSPQSPEGVVGVNILQAEASPVRLSREFSQQKEEFQKVASPKNHGFTFTPSADRVDRRTSEDRLMSTGSLPRKTKKTNYATGRSMLSAKQAATPPWVQAE